MYHLHPLTRTQFTIQLRMSLSFIFIRNMIQHWTNARLSLINQPSPSSWFFHRKLMWFHSGCVCSFEKQMSARSTDDRLFNRCNSYVLPSNLFHLFLFFLAIWPLLCCCCCCYIHCVTCVHHVWNAAFAITFSEELLEKCHLFRFVVEMYLNAMYVYHWQSTPTCSIFVCLCTFVCLWSRSIDSTHKHTFAFAGYIKWVAQNPN